MKKCIPTLFTILVLVACLVMTASAAVLQIDADKITADNYQNNPSETPASNHVFLPKYAVLQTPNSNSPDATIVQRWTGTIREADDVNVEGKRVIIDGVSTNSIVIPFVDNVTIDSISLKMNHNQRGYFFKMYVSDDGTNWTEVKNINSGAKKGNLTKSYDANGDFGGPSVNEVWKTDVSGGTESDINPITITLSAATSSAKFLKFTFYGHDGARGDWEATDGSQWMGFNCLTVMGNVVTAPEPESATSANPAQAPTEKLEAPAPKTGDSTSMLFMLLSVSAAGFVSLKRCKKQ